MTQRRVMHVVAGGDIGGAERLLVDLARHPDETEAEHEVALFASTNALPSYFHDAGLRVHRRGLAPEAPIAYLRRSFGSADVGWLAALLSEQAIDVVHTHTFGSHVLGTRAACRAGVPQLRTEHHVSHFTDPSCSPFTRWAAARTQRFVAVSEYVRSALARAAPNLAARTRVVRNGVDTRYWAPLPLPPAERAFSVAIVCRLTAWKRVELAIDAVALAGVALVVVGDGEERAGLERRSARRGASVRFVGHQADPRPFVAGASATLNTSKDEPLGLSVLESLSMSRPVVAFAGGGVPEIVQDGITGTLIAKAKAPDFAAALSSLRAERGAVERMGQSGRQFVLEHCSVQRMCAGYAAEYRELSGRA